MLLCFSLYANLYFKVSLCTFLECSTGAVITGTDVAFNPYML
jgi:hypothetical protein